MGFIALILALLIEQGRPLPRENVAHNVIRWVASSVRAATDAGTYRYGVIGWCIVVLGTAVLIWGLHWLFAHLHPIALFVFHVVVLYYFALGLRFLGVFYSVNVSSGIRSLLPGHLS